MSTGQEIEQRIQEVYKRIQTERKVLEASRSLRQATTNPDVLRRNDAQIREAEKSLSYFEDALKELQARKTQMNRQSTSAPSPGAATGLPPGPRGWGDRDRALPSPPGSGSMDSGFRQTDELVQKPKNYTNLGMSTLLIKPLETSSAARSHQGRYAIHARQDFPNASPVGVQAPGREAIQERNRSDGKGVSG